MIRLMSDTARLTASAHSLDSKWSSMKKEKFPSFTSRSKFDNWYESVTAMLSTREWRSLYDEVDQVPRKETTPMNEEESNILYSHLKVAIKGEIDNLFLDSNEYISKGLKFLEAIRRECVPKLTFIQKQEKRAEMAMICRGEKESIAEYSVRVRKLHHLLKDNGHHESPEQLRVNFINGLGPDFSTIHAYMDLSSELPPYLVEWKSTDLKELTLLAKTYLRNQEARKTFEKKKKEVKSDQNKSSSSSNSEKKTTNKNVNRATTTTTPENETSPYKAWQRYIKLLIGRGEFSERQERHLQTLVDRRFGTNCCLYHLTSSHKSSQCQLVNNFLIQAGNSPIDNENKPTPEQPSLPTIQQVNDGVAYAQQMRSRAGGTCQHNNRIIPVPPPKASISRII